MKRSTWFLIAGVVPAVFGILMLIAPDKFAQNLMTQPLTDSVLAWVRFMGGCLIAFGWINFMARTSPLSGAVRGIMSGNILLHLLGIVTDWYGYSEGVVTMGGAMQGLVIHAVFMIGFGYFLMAASKEASHSVQTA